MTGRIGGTPSLRFAGKVGLVSDRRGEKLSDGFVASVLARLFESHPPRPSFTLLAPDCEDRAVRYVLYMNATPFTGIDESLDRLLCENPHYAYCRQLDQLRPPQAAYIRSDAYAAYCARLTRQGQRLGDIKPAALSPLDGWSELFECFVAR